jgi:hypothetical protein
MLFTPPLFFDVNSSVNHHVEGKMTIKSIWSFIRVEMPFFVMCPTPFFHSLASYGPEIVVTIR